MSRENNVFYWLPCSVVFVSTAHEDKRDIMTATAIFVSQPETRDLQPPTYNLIDQKPQTSSKQQI